MGIDVLANHQVSGCVKGQLANYYTARYFPVSVRVIESRHSETLLNDLIFPSLRPEA